MESYLQKYIGSSTTRNAYYDSGFDIYDEVQGASIPLTYIDVDNSYNIRQISLLEEVDLALQASNGIADIYPNSETLVSGQQFRAIGQLFPANFSVVDITHGHDPDSGITYWFAIVNTSRDECEIWRSVDKVTWTPCTIDFTAYHPRPFLLNYIETEAEGHTDDLRYHRAPVIIAVGQDGLVVKSTDFLHFKVEPITSIASANTANFVDIAYSIDDDSWTILGDSSSPFQLAYSNTRDPLGSDWVPLNSGNPVMPSPTAMCWGTYGGTSRWVIVGNGAISYSLGTSDVWTKIDMPAINFTGLTWTPDQNLFVAVGNETNASAFGAIFTSPDGINWTRRNVANNLQAQLSDVDYGNKRLVVSSKRMNSFWYTNENDFNNFFSGTITGAPEPFYGTSVQYGGGDTQSWLMTSDTTNEVVISDNIAEYHGALTDQYFGHATKSVGTFVDTWYDSDTGEYLSDSSEIYMFYDSDISYDTYFGKDQSIYLGMNIEGDFREMWPEAAIHLGTRLSTYSHTFNMPGTFYLERDDLMLASGDALSWEPWISPVFYDTVETGVKYSYTIWRRRYDSSVPTDQLRPLELDNFQATDYVDDDYVEDPYDYYINSYFNGIRPLTLSRSHQVARNLMFLGNKETDVGTYYLLEEGVHPADLGETGEWKTSGHGDNTYIDPTTGAHLLEKRYYLWVKNAPSLLEDLRLRMRSGDADIQATVHIGRITSDIELKADNHFATVTGKAACIKTYKTSADIKSDDVTVHGYPIRVVYPIGSGVRIHSNNSKSTGSAEKIPKPWFVGYFGASRGDTHIPIQSQIRNLQILPNYAYILGKFYSLWIATMDNEPEKLALDTPNTRYHQNSIWCSSNGRDWHTKTGILPVVEVDGSVQSRAVFQNGRWMCAGSDLTDPYNSGGTFWWADVPEGRLPRTADWQKMPRAFSGPRDVPEIVPMGINSLYTYYTKNTDWAFYRSTNNGNSWTACPKPPVSGNNGWWVTGIADGQQNGYIINFRHEGPGYISRNLGQSWTAISVPGGDYGARPAVTYQYGRYIITGRDGHIAYSWDGVTWHELPNHYSQTGVDVYPHILWQDRHWTMVGRQASNRYPRSYHSFDLVHWIPGYNFNNHLDQPSEQAYSVVDLNGQGIVTANTNFSDPKVSYEYSYSQWYDYTQPYGDIINLL